MAQSLQSLVDLDPYKLMSMPTADLRKVVTRLNSAANKRLKRLEDTVTPATIAVNRGGGKFSVKGLTTPEQVRNAYMRVRGFLQDPTSTKSGMKGMYDEFREALQVEGYEVQDGDIARLVGLHDAIRNKDKSKEEKYKALQDSAEILGKNNADIRNVADLLWDMEAYFHDITGVDYAGNRSGGANSDNISEFFEF